MVDCRRRIARSRRGASKLGCLVLFVLLGVGVYVGVSVGRIYYRYYGFEDDMRQSARFAAQISDSAIQHRLSLAADSLGLPSAARAVRITRIGRTISIDARYTEVLDLRVYKHFLYFSPSVRATF